MDSTILLRGLSVAAVAVLARSALDARATPEVIDACASQTGGNPFLLRELLAELPPGPVTPLLVRECGPAGLARVVAARLAAAGPPAAALADAVAILGDGIDLRVAAHLGGLEATQATLAADNLARLGVFGSGRPSRSRTPSFVKRSTGIGLPASGRWRTGPRPGC